MDDLKDFDEDLDDLDEKGELSNETKTKKRKIGGRTYKSKLNQKFFKSIELISEQIKNKLSNDFIKKALKSSLEIKSLDDCFKVIKIIDGMGIKKSREKIIDLKKQVLESDKPFIVKFENSNEEDILKTINEMEEKVEYYLVLIELLKEIVKVKNHDATTYDVIRDLMLNIIKDGKI